MTENEVFEHIGDLAGDYKCFDEKISHQESLILCNLIEEVQQYRAIGTVEEFKALKENNETLKALYEDARKEGSHLIARERAKAIDEFAEKLIKHISQMPSGYIGSGNVHIIAEQLKAGVKNE